MALDLKVKLCPRCDRIEVVDYTGTYDADDNTGGYGDPNLDFGELVPYTIAIYEPKATAPLYTLDLLAAPPTPDADGHYTWNIPIADLEVDVIKSGVWRFVVTAGDDDDVNGGVPIVLDCQTLFFGDLQTKIAKRFCTEGCGCDYKERLASSIKLKGAKEEYGCGRYEKAQDIITALYRDVRNDCGCH